MIMKTLVSSETLETAFKNDKNFKQFIDDYAEYFEYLLIMNAIQPHFELTFEDFINGKNKQDRT